MCIYIYIYNYPLLRYSKNSAEEVVEETVIEEVEPIKIKEYKPKRNDKLKEMVNCPVHKTQPSPRSLRVPTEGVFAKQPLKTLAPR